jgi:hypothetical protein
VTIQGEWRLIKMYKGNLVLLQNKYSTVLCHQMAHKDEEEDKGKIVSGLPYCRQGNCQEVYGWCGSCTSHENNRNVLKPFDPVSRVRAVGFLTSQRLLRVPLALTSKYPAICPQNILFHVILKIKSDYLPKYSFDLLNKDTCFVYCTWSLTL